MEMAATVHCIPPLRRHDPNRAQMSFDLASHDIGLESRLVDQQRFVLDRGVRRQAMGGDLVLQDSQVLERCQFDGHRRFLLWLYS